MCHTATLLRGAPLAYKSNKSEGPGVRNTLVHWLFALRIIFIATRKRYQRLSRSPIRYRTWLEEAIHDADLVGQEQPET